MKQASDKKIEFKHKTVMLAETVDALNVAKGKLYLDATLGGGGHSSRVLEQGGYIVAFDKDTTAINHVREKFSTRQDFIGKFTLIHDSFFNAKEALKNAFGQDIKLSGAILDLGFSSNQVDDKNRGFSYMQDGILDMRMDKTQKLTAKKIINEYEREDLLKILYEYGEENNAKKIVNAIIAKREQAEIKTTKELSDLVISCFSPFVKGGHPAKKTFQALRIETNSELDGLEQAIKDIIDLLEVGARISIISFHSLEDRIVKNTFKDLSEVCKCNKNIPICICEHKPSLKLINKGIKPSQQELCDNPRAKSATLRVAEKL